MYGLRKALGPDRLIRRPPGYVLRVEPDELDRDRFDHQLFREGREALARGDANAASAALHTALGLWRGPALADVLDEPFAGTESGRLEEWRLLALEERVEADLARGAAAELVSRAGTAGARRAVSRAAYSANSCLLSTAQDGRQRRCLYSRHGRLRFAEELGLDFGPQVVELQRKILAHDLSLAASRGRVTPQPRPPHRRPRRWAIAVAAAVLLAVGLSLGIVLGTGGGAPKASSGSPQVVGLDLRSGAVSKVVPLTENAAAVATGYGSLWLADPSGGSIARVDLDSGAVVDRVPVRGSPGALAVGAGSVWAASVPGERVTRIDPDTGAVTQSVPLGAAPERPALAFGEGATWVADVTDNSLIELDPASGAVRRTLALNLRPTALGIGDRG